MLKRIRISIPQNQHNPDNCEPDPVPDILLLPDGSTCVDWWEHTFYSTGAISVYTTLLMYNPSL